MRIEQWIQEGDNQPQILHTETRNIYPCSGIRKSCTSKWRLAGVNNNCIFCWKNESFSNKRLNHSQKNSLKSQIRRKVSKRNMFHLSNSCFASRKRSHVSRKILIEELNSIKNSRKKWQRCKMNFCFCVERIPYLYKRKT